MCIHICALLAVSCLLWSCRWIRGTFFCLHSNRICQPSGLFFYLLARGRNMSHDQACTVLGSIKRCSKKENKLNRKARQWGRDSCTSSTLQDSEYGQRIVKSRMQVYDRAVKRNLRLFCCREFNREWNTRAFTSSEHLLSCEQFKS